MINRSENYQRFPRVAQCANVPGMRECSGIVAGSIGC